MPINVAGEGPDRGRPHGERAEGSKKALSAALRATEAVIEAFGGKSATVVSLGGQPMTHVLGETFDSQTPYLQGANVTKFSIAPSSPGLLELVGKSVELGGRANAHREEIQAFFAESGAEWELRVQLLTDAETMPVEDPSAASSRSVRTAGRRRRLRRSTTACRSAVARARGAPGARLDQPRAQGEL